ncbi:hypothetical protein HO173_011552 [Letharia columbiana]|uniref:Uncharacterized protein n=1 Tax=Letharia columbiana TaxID=112416 RepID=A0A8H6FJ98_9LECA|nr:uncharacterized protein HO173_011552 [Letharia columbiana]KAF6229512.1 hypothetical protein HO173_011552 [Letharia columbiana]
MNTLKCRLLEKPPHLQHARAAAALVSERHLPPQSPNSGARRSRSHSSARVSPPPLTTLADGIIIAVFIASTLRHRSQS